MKLQFHESRVVCVSKSVLTAACGALALLNKTSSKYISIQMIIGQQTWRHVKQTQRNAIYHTSHYMWHVFLRWMKEKGDEHKTMLCSQETYRCERGKRCHAWVTLKTSKHSFSIPTLCSHPNQRLMMSRNPCSTDCAFSLWWVTQAGSQHCHRRSVVYLEGIMCGIPDSPNDHLSVIQSRVVIKNEPLQMLLKIYFL